MKTKLKTLQVPVVLDKLSQWNLQLNSLLLDVKLNNKLKQS